MNVLPQTPLDWVLIAVALATAIIIAVALQDCFVDARISAPRIRAFQDLSVGLAVTQFGVLLLRGSAGPNWAIAGIALYVAATLLFLSALEAARRVPLPRTFVDDPTWARPTRRALRELPRRSRARRAAAHRDVPAIHRPQVMQGEGSNP